MRARAVLPFVFASLFSVTAHAFQATAVRIADAGCAKCHKEIFQKYLSTPMAHASGRAEENLIPGNFFHAPSAVEYAVSNGNGQPHLTFRSRKNPHISGEYPLSYFLGSAHLGTTYLYELNHYLFESPVAWYAASHGYDMKPGLAAMTQMPPFLPMQSGCLRCHMSAVQRSDPGTINHYSGLPFLHSGITCEACHGDAQRHVRSGGKDAIVNPAHLDPDRRDAVCISCHLEGDVSVERARHSALDYHPGDSISDYLAFYVYAGNNLTARGVSEVEQFAQSTCKRMSGDKMSCTSCHDPHFTPAPEQRASFFRKKCLACHNQPQFVASHHPENPDCTSCHMRHTGAENIPHVAWTDHRILRLPAPPDAAAQHHESDDLSAVFSPGATRRDLAMAYYQAFLEGNQSVEPKAWKLLQEQRSAIGNDEKALDAYGNLSAGRGDSQAAEAAFQQVLKLDARDLTALSNLGILRARQGNLPSAISLLQSAFDVNKDVAGLAMNLARVQCMAGDTTGARTTVDAALVYAPGLQDLVRMRDQMTDCSAPKGQGAGQR
ncbi:MAG TPA: multiheme c-type cytochrome [Terriglobales bacterium]|nr:multiheme c-type cytochrome [Terriglobales bacterium]